jgi:hypothetical protein
MSEPRDMDAPVTRRELRDALDTWGGTIVDRLIKLDSKLDDLERRMDGKLHGVEMRLKDELRQHTRSSETELAGRLVAVDEHYRDLPIRVTRLENKVFAPPKRRRRVQRSR